MDFITQRRRSRSSAAFSLVGVSLRYCVGAIVTERTPLTRLARVEGVNEPGVKRVQLVGCC